MFFVKMNTLVEALQNAAAFLSFQWSVGKVFELLQRGQYP